MTRQAELLLRIGAEGGSIAVYGSSTIETSSQFRVLMIDHTATFLEFDEGGAPSRRDSGWLTSWADAMTALARWPWPHLVPLFVNKRVARDVWNAVEGYRTKSGREIRVGALERWRDACSTKPPIGALDDGFNE